MDKYWINNNILKPLYKLNFLKMRYIVIIKKFVNTM
jgi:hypothetical protein